MVQGPLTARTSLPDQLRDNDRAWRQLVIYDQYEWYLKFVEERRLLPRCCWMMLDAAGCGSMLVDAVGWQ